MRIRSHWSDGSLELRLEPEEGDPLRAAHARLAGRQARFQPPVPIAPDDVHPDVEALLALLMVGPFSAGVRMDRGVSPAFADVVRDRYDRTVGPVDPGLAPRLPPAGGVVGLAFSAGADSTAALHLLPPETVPGYLCRIDPPGGAQPAPFTVAAAMAAIDGYGRAGRAVRVVRSDVVHLRDPVGFTTDWVNGAGLMLLADIDRLGGLAWGVIAESAYQVGHERYRDWAERQGLLWGPLFAAVGLPMCQVTAGVSEVGTSTIVRATRPDLVASCQFGPLGAPCGECWKCFRKRLLDAALAGAWPSDEAIEAMLRSPAVKAKLMKSPIKHEDVLAWILARYRGRHPVMLHLAAQTHAHEQDLDWLTRYYRPSIDILPAFLRDGTRTRLDAFLQPMAPQDEAAFRAWDMAPRLADPSTARAHAAVVRALGGRDPSRRRSLAGRVVGSLRRRLSG